MARIKIVHNSDVRRISDSVLKAQNPYTALVEYVRAIFHIPADLEPAQLVLAYNDDEGDVVTISSALELREALRIAEQESRRSLKIFLSTAGPEGAYLAARTASLGGGPPSSSSDTFSDLASFASGPAAPASPASPAGAQSPRSEGESSFVYVDEGAEPTAEAPQPTEEPTTEATPVASDPSLESKAEPEPEHEPEEDWTGFPEPAQLHAWFTDFMANPTAQAQIPTAITVTYDALLAGDSTLDQALNLAFDACPAIAEHPLVAHTRRFLPQVVKGVRQWVSTLVPLGEPMLQILAPQVLQLLPGMFDGGRPDMQLDITDAFYQVRAQEQQQKKKAARKQRRAQAHAAKRQAEEAAAKAARDDDESAESDEEDDNEIHITVRVPKWLRRVLEQQGQHGRRGPCSRRGRRRGACAPPPPPPCGFPGLFGMPMGSAAPGPFGAGPLAGLASMFGGMTPPTPPAPTPAPASAPEPQPEPAQPPVSMPVPPVFQRPLDATLVSEGNVPKGAVLPPDAFVMKTWSMTNSGSTAWPVGTKLIRRKIDRGFVMDHEFDVPVAAPGETVDVMAMVGVPAEVGKRFRASYRLRTPHPRGKMFGPTLFIDFVVDANAVVPGLEPKAAEEEKAVEAERVEAERVEAERVEAERVEEARKVAEEEARKAAEEEAREAAEHQARVEAEMAAVLAEKARLEAEAEAAAAQERARVEAEAAAEAELRAREAEAAARAEAASAAAAAAAAPPAEHPRWEVQLTGLASMGFSNRDANVFLLEKHHGDMHRVVTDLVNGGGN